ncbi:hypothetical protein [Streptomyces sp. NPDC014622]|uniref:hypothetical protein n=1 Tax=Streptomyces sp. NPDC014622 TaxID=3364874 RepID=UPI0036FA5D2D
MGEWGYKPLPVMSKRERKRAAAGAPKRKFATINGERVEVHQAREREARPYPSAPVNARPGSVVAAAILRTPTRKPDEIAKAVPSGVREGQYVAPLEFGGRGTARPLRTKMTKAEQANNLPFMPEFQAEGQPFPRISRDKDGNAVPRVRTDNGMTEQLKGRGIGRREDGKSTYTKRQLAAQDAERQRRYETAMEVVRLHDIADTQDRLRNEAKQGLAYCLGVEREALASGDMDRAEWARESIRAYRKAARYK